MKNFWNLAQTKCLEDYNESYTENGAKGWKTTGKELLDLNYSVASYRTANEADIIIKFNRAFKEDPALAVAWLFYVRDAREGIGERRLFRVCFKNVIEKKLENVDSCYSSLCALLKLVPTYGRWDDLWSLIGINNSLNKMITEIIQEQLSLDINSMKEGKPVSLLAKWLPSESASSEKTVEDARHIMHMLEMTPKRYRQCVSALRKWIDVVEVKMCDCDKNKWEEINYSKVPSKANLKYKSAFLRHDYARYTKYIESVNAGEQKMNASVLFPYEIVTNYRGAWKTGYNAPLEALWKNLPNSVNGQENTIVVADGSGSMNCRISGNTTAWDVATALAIYFAERSNGAYKDKYITFSHNPQFVDLSKCNNLKDKLLEAAYHNEVADTDIYKVFKLILDTAITNDCIQEDLPANILILSDMEFNNCAVNANEKLFKTIQKEYIDAGYKLPRLIFWNVASRTLAIPLRNNDLGVALISGFSVNLVKLVLQNEIDPYKLLLNTLNGPRYNNVYELYKSIDT